MLAVSRTGLMMSRFTGGADRGQDPLLVGESDAAEPIVSELFKFASGVLYIEPDKQDFIDLLGLVDEPLASLDTSRVRPGKQALDEIMESFR